MSLVGFRGDKYNRFCGKHIDDGLDLQIYEQFRLCGMNYIWDSFLKDCRAILNQNFCTALKLKLPQCN